MSSLFGVATAAPSCHAVFDSSEIKDFNRWEETFSKVSNSNEFAAATNELRRKSMDLSREDVVALQSLNLEKIIQNLSPGDQEKIRWQVDLAISKIEKAADSSDVDFWLRALEFHLYPERLNKFVFHLEAMSKRGFYIQDAVAGLYGLNTLNRTFISALESASELTKTGALKLIGQKLSQVSLEGELLKMDGENLVTPVQRTYRRNLETLIFFLLHKDIANLKSATSQKELINAVEKYFLKSNKVFMPNRGGYKFSLVLNSAKIVQKNFKGYLDNDSKFIDLYGSFPNGKASLKFSDIDIKFSDEIIKTLTGKTKTEIKEDSFNLYFADVAEKYNLEFWDHYQKAERELGSKILARKPLKPSELLSTIYPPRDYSNDALDFRWYNPIILRIFKDRVDVMVVDLLN